MTVKNWEPYLGTEKMHKSLNINSEEGLLFKRNFLSLPYQNKSSETVSLTIIFAKMSGLLLHEMHITWLHK